MGQTCRRRFCILTPRFEICPPLPSRCESPVLGRSSRARWGSVVQRSVRACQPRGLLADAAGAGKTEVDAASLVECGYAGRK